MGIKKTNQIKIIISICLLIVFCTVFFFKGEYIINSLGFQYELPFGKTLKIPPAHTSLDNNQNGISDALDIVRAARVEVKNKTHYESNYYRGGFPPDTEGVCTDVVWRGLRGINVNLKELMDQDIMEHVELYPRVEGKPDPNIDFRRVPNQEVFFNRNADKLTTELIPYDVDNLKQWQPGDIVLYLGDFDHVGIISDRRAKDGTPYLIHNLPPFASEIKLTSLSKPIYAHYRWKYKNN